VSGCINRIPALESCLKGILPLPLGVWWWMDEEGMKLIGD